VTHDEVRPEDFNGSRHIVRNILAAFNEQATVQWFASFGVISFSGQPTFRILMNFLEH
jgi:hypothetical protein